MTEVVGQRRAAPAPRTANNRIGGFVWFGLMAGGWIAFVVLASTSGTTLDDLHGRLRDLPLVVEALVWFLLFPYVLALTVWESAWAEWLRAILVGAFASGWSLAFYPWRRGGTTGR